ncbi:OmpA family protein [Pseudomonas nitroreducens]|uniref:OmpA family protein n=1 Tax=Pseudomonas nitroreducens TaxID=46680 RepID=UPI00351CD7CC
MSALAELGIRPGSDPRGRREFTVLCDELAKLSHPARPDVDWAKVEHYCLGLLQSNGGDLQTVAFLVLALGHRRGIAGLAEGVELLQRLLANGAERLWPPQMSARVDILAWLFTQLQPLLRGMDVSARDLMAIGRVVMGLALLDEDLGRQSRLPLMPLQAFRQQVDSLAARLARSAGQMPSNGRVVGRVALGERVTPAAKTEVVTSPVVPTPTVIPPEPPAPSQKPEEPRRIGVRRRLWFAVLAVALLLFGLLGWLLLGWTHGQSAWRAQQATGAIEPVSIEPAPAAVAEPLRLDSRLLFATGSAQLKSDATKVLINALANVKARPGWRIVIAGHTDATGDAQRNLQLSRERAAAVRDWMQRMGDVPEDCFSVQGYGASEPIESNETESGRTANRRVDIRLLPEAGACQVGSEGRRQ